MTLLAINTPDVTVEAESHTLVTEHTLAPDTDLWRMLASLRETRYTGEVRIMVHCGGVRKITVTHSERVHTAK